MWFGRSAKRVLECPATQPGMRVYAIGDIHGRFDLLTDLLERIEQHAFAQPDPADTRIVILGDMIDRGPDSAAVVAHLHAMQQQDDRLVVLLGNHEELMLRAMTDEPGVMRAWVRAGGDATLLSFGVAPPHDADDIDRCAADLRQAVPMDRIEWMGGLPLTARSGDYLFCHAGIRPGVAIKRQRRGDLLWIRDEFLEDERDHGVVVVHGHSISEGVEDRGNRIGIDTGAYRSGMLTGLYLEGGTREVLTVNGPGESDVMPGIRRA
ncbi:metallophosphoesterase family protein [Sphingobium aquiterrae]|uniref:metallophosphoesterase family protein n=1 Tax=Sphingobium aquiterrae TaxID=2038656 RepID=UPI0030196098